MLTSTNIADLVSRGFPAEHILYLIRYRLRSCGRSQDIPAAEIEALEEIKKLEGSNGVS